MYSNPPENLELRVFYTPESEEYSLIKNKIYDEFSASTNPAYYCLSHHSVETRSTIEGHEKCVFLNKSDLYTKSMLCFLIIPFILKKLIE